MGAATAALTLPGRIINSLRDQTELGAFAEAYVFSGGVHTSSACNSDKSRDLKRK